MLYRFQVRPGFVELELFGELREMEPFTPEEWRTINALRAILYNYDEVDAIGYNPWDMSASAKKAAERGIRLAAFAAKPAWFGVNRQMAQMSEAGEGSVRVFRERAEAVTWLLHGDARPD